MEACEDCFLELERVSGESGPSLDARLPGASKQQDAKQAVFSLWFLLWCQPTAQSLLVGEHFGGFSSDGGMCSLGGGEGFNEQKT